MTRDWPVRAISEQPEFCGVGHRRRPRRHIELGQRIGDVAMHGVLADMQALGDRLVAETAGDQAQHVQLTRRQATVIA